MYFLSTDKPATLSFLITGSSKCHLNILPICYQFGPLEFLIPIIDNDSRVMIALTVNDTNCYKKQLNYIHTNTPSTQSTQFENQMVQKYTPLSSRTVTIFFSDLQQSLRLYTVAKNHYKRPQYRGQKEIKEYLTHKWLLVFHTISITFL